MLYKGEAIYSIDERTAELVKNNPYDPAFVILLTLVTMTIAGLMLCLSPYIAYRISTGQVFEAVSSTASGWMAAMLGSFIEYKGLKAGASLQREAENTQIQGGYQAEMTRARTTLDTSNIGAQARKVSSVAGIEASRVSSVGQIVAGGIQARAQVNAGANYTIAATGAQVRDSNRQTDARMSQGQRQAEAAWSNDSMRTASESSAFKWDNVGNYMAAVPMVGAVPQAQAHGFGNTVRTQGRNNANEWLFARTMKNEQLTAGDIIFSQNMYRSDIENHVGTMRAESIAGINQAVGTGVGAANRGAAIATGGVNQAYQLELKANEMQFQGTKEAAQINRDASFEAARDRQMGTLLSGMSRDMSRRIEESMRQRY